MRVGVPLVPSLTAARLGLWPSGLAIASLPLVSRPWTGLCWSHLMSLSSVSVRFVVLPRQLVGSGLCSPASTICPPSSIVMQSSFGVLCFSFASSLHDEVTLPGQVCLSPRSERRLSLHLPGVWLESSRMKSPCRVVFVSDLDRNKDSSRTFPSGWCRAFTMGSPVSGHVAYFCTLDRNEGFFHPSVLSCFAMGSPYGLSVNFLPLDRNEVFFG